MDSKQVYIIDSMVGNMAAVVAGLPENADYLVVNGASSGVSQIADYLQQFDAASIASLHIVSHGTDGEILLGNTALNNNSLQTHKDTLKSIGTYLADTGDILIYGCNVAMSEVGKGFMQAIARMTSANVAASDDMTSSDGKGDTELEYKIGAIGSEANENIIRAADPLQSDPYTETVISRSDFGGRGDFRAELSYLGSAASGFFNAGSGNDIYLVSPLLHANRVSIADLDTGNKLYFDKGVEIAFIGGSTGAGFRLANDTVVDFVGDGTNQTYYFGSKGTEMTYTEFTQTLKSEGVTVFSSSIPTPTTYSVEDYVYLSDLEFNVTSSVTGNYRGGEEVNLISFGSSQDRIGSGGSGKDVYRVSQFQRGNVEINDLGQEDLIIIENGVQVINVAANVLQFIGGTLAAPQIRTLSVGNSSTDFFQIGEDSSLRYTGIELVANYGETGLPIDLALITALRDDWTATNKGVLVNLLSGDVELNSHIVSAGKAYFYNDTDLILDDGEVFALDVGANAHEASIHRNHVAGSKYADFIAGNSNDNTLRGGAGADTFIFIDLFGSDTISDFESSDSLLLDEDATYSISDDSKTITVTDGSVSSAIRGTITLNGAIVQTSNISLTAPEVTYGAPNFAGVATIYDIQENNIANTSLQTNGEAINITATGGNITYRLLPQNDHQFFSIDGATGVLSSNLAFDFEDAMDTDMNNQYIVAVEGSSRKGAAVHTVTINVTNKDEAPQFNNPANMGQIAENTIGAVTDESSLPIIFSATDPEKAEIIYAIVGDTPFAIGRTSGNLRAAEKLNFEGQSSYDLQITATDGSHTITHNITIEVKDVNEAPTFDESISTMGAIYEMRDEVALSVVATDPDGDNITYSLTGADSSNWSIDDEGNISPKTAASFSYADPTDTGEDNSYNFTVVATDDGGLRGELDVTIGINGLPNFGDHETHPATFAENDANGLGNGEGIDLMATLPTGGFLEITGISNKDNTTSGITADDFTLDGGILKLKTDGLDREAIDNRDLHNTGTLTLTIGINDGETDTPLAETEIVLEVRGRNDEAPMISSATTITLAEGEGFTSYDEITIRDGDYGDSSSYFSQARELNIVFNESESTGVDYFRVKYFTNSDSDKYRDARFLDVYNTIDFEDPEGQLVSIDGETYKAFYAAFTVTDTGVGVDAKGRVGLDTITVLVSDVDEIGFHSTDDGLWQLDNSADNREFQIDDDFRLVWQDSDSTSSVDSLSELRAGFGTGFTAQITNGNIELTFADDKKITLDKTADFEASDIADFDSFVTALGGDTSIGF